MAHKFTAIVSSNDVCIKAAKMGCKDNGSIPYEVCKAWGVDTENIKSFWLRFSLGNKEITKQKFMNQWRDKFTSFNTIKDKNFFYGNFDSLDFKIEISLDNNSTYNVVDQMKAKLDDRYSYNHHIDMSYSNAMRNALTIQMRARVNENYKDLKESKYNVK